MSPSGLGLMMLILAGCSKSEPSAADTAVVGICDTGLDVTWSNWGAGFFRSYCTSCHSVNTEDRWGAPEGINFDTQEDVTQWMDSIRNAVLVNSTMPVGGGVYDEDLALLDRFLTCGL